jgi:branched-chain amino acid aminotransferase
MIAASEDVVARNEHLRGPHGDWWVCQRISRGVDAVGDEGWEHTGPNLVIDVSPLPLDARAAMYRDGAEIMTTTMRRTAPSMLSPRAKMNNYLNMIVAAQPIKAAQPEAWPLLLDEHGNLAEGQGSNIFVVEGGMLRTPRERYVLAGVSRQMVIDLAAKLGIGCAESDIDLFDAANAEEMFLTSTSLCILPVRLFNGAAVGGAWTGAGAVTQRLIDAYAEAVGCDFVRQYLDRLAA